MLATPTIDRVIHWFTGVRVLLIAVMAAAVVIGWQANSADATEDTAATFTVCSDIQGRLRMVDDADECNSNEEFLELDLATGRALDDATQDLEEKISELESDLQGRIDELEQTIDDQAAQIQALEERVDELEEEQDGAPGDDGLGERVTSLEELLGGVSRVEVDGHDTLRFAEMNVQVVNGHEDEATNTANGLGNLIIGYNEGVFGADRSGSHNIVVGTFHSYSASGGLVVGQQNTISGDFASVSGGLQNTASGDWASVSGGSGNIASGGRSSVSGGLLNEASDLASSVSGGFANVASGASASVSGGLENTASADRSSVSGGLQNTAGQVYASVSGGSANSASGVAASVSGGEGNDASGDRSSILGGQEITVDSDLGMHPEP